MTVRNLLVATSLGGAAFAPAALPAGALPVADVAARSGIPEVALTAYVRAAHEAPCAIDWSDLAAIGAVESGHGTHGGAHLDPSTGVLVGRVESWAGAQGPMQFIPDTWAHYGAGGNVDDIDDAAPATARLLCANGFAADRDNAIGAYNGGANWRSYAESRDYVPAVNELAARYRSLGHVVLDGVPSLPGDGVVEEGLTLRIGDRLLYRAYLGWKRLVGWGSESAPNAVPVLHATDDVVTRLWTSAEVGAPEASGAPAFREVGGLVCPVPGATITSDWGDARDGGARAHQGIDLADDEGTPVLAPFNARVVETVDVEADGGLGGISLWLEAVDGSHKGALVYLAHNRRNTVRAGQTVAAGQQVAELGNTGVGTGPHSHVSWAPDGGAFTDPAPIRTACQEATR